ncbi:helix-turn-helix domain-containing protein [Kineobactrum salinum]|uniref:Helix-turn-helix transcriptional regulator n=1 Tax=Kineobactrum salinum TaxID=2708301 RepID=A0A6C0U4C7_9GAMM|nr:AraC family transcriptional regulator [Kineobactrum salinum]QIB66992.1 helix-turn-helix transcriptional regulator [Kineobactrum salinum]
MKEPPEQEGFRVHRQGAMLELIEPERRKRPPFLVGEDFFDFNALETLVRKLVGAREGLAGIRVPFPGGGCTEYLPIEKGCLLALNRNIQSTPELDSFSYRTSDWAALRVRISGFFREQISSTSMTAGEGNASLLYFGSGCRYGLNLTADSPVSGVSLVFHPDIISRRVLGDADLLLERLRGEVTETHDLPHLIAWPGDLVMQGLALQILQLDSAAPVFRIMAESLALSLFARCITLLGSDSVEATDQAVRLRAKDLQQLEVVRKVLETDFCNSHTLEELSRLAGINRRKLTEGFRSLFGTSVGEYAINQRMRRARILLLEGIRVGEVAEQVGYQDQGSFSRAFKRVVGVNPRAFST